MDAPEDVTGVPPLESNVTVLPDHFQSYTPASPPPVAPEKVTVIEVVAAVATSTYPPSRRPLVCAQLEQCTKVPPALILEIVTEFCVAAQNINVSPAATGCVSGMTHVVATADPHVPASFVALPNGFCSSVHSGLLAAVAPVCCGTVNCARAGTLSVHNRNRHGTSARGIIAPPRSMSPQRV